MIWPVYGSPVWFVSISTPSPTDDSLFLQSNVTTSLIYSELLPCFFPILSVAPMQVPAWEAPPAQFHFSHYVLAACSDFCHSQLSCLKRCVLPVVSSRMRPVLFSSVTALLSLTIIVMELGIWDPFMVPLLYVPAMVWLQSWGKTEQCTGPIPPLPSKFLPQWSCFHGD